MPSGGTEREHWERIALGKTHLFFIHMISFTIKLFEVAALWHPKQHSSPGDIKASSKFNSDCFVLMATRRKNANKIQLITAH